MPENQNLLPDNAPKEIQEAYQKIRSQIDGFLSAIKNESIRGSAVITGGFLESLLGDFLDAHFIDDRVSRELLKGSNAVLGSFGARIDLCYALRLIDPDTHKNLHQIRKIRNKFAHKASTSIEDQDIVDLCKSLVIHSGTMQVSQPRAKLYLMSVILISNLKNRVDQERQLRHPLKQF